MADLNTSTNHSTGRGRSMKALPNVDLTAMVDLAFLLITFFMLTTTLAKPRELKVVMPADTDPANVNETRTLSLCLGKNDQLYWYIGMPEKPLAAPARAGYQPNGIRSVLTAQSARVLKQSAGKGLIVLIKPGDRSTIKNLVAILDEIDLTAIKTYSIVAPAKEDIIMMRGKGVL